MKNTRTVVAATAVAVVLVLAGCGLPGGSRDPEGAGADVVDGGVPSLIPGQKPPGTRRNPLPPGVTFELEDQWQVRFEDTNRDARQALIDGDEYNRQVVTDAIPSGSAPVLVFMQLTYVGQGSGRPIDLQVRFLGNDSNTYTDSCPGLYEGSYVQAQEMFPGAEQTVTACIVIPQNHIDGGAWLVEGPFQSLDRRERVFVGLGGA